MSARLASPLACALTACLLAALSCVAAEPARQPFRLVSAEDDARYRRLLPDTDDEWLREVYASHLIFYTDREMPPAYQLDGGAHSPSYNISARKPAEPHGNPNIEFPWGHPGGTHRSPNVSAVRFVHLPAAVQWWPESFGRYNLMRWQYPEKTTFGEILLVHDGQGSRYTFEVRTRTKRQGSWRANVFRPFASRAELDDFLSARFLGFDALERKVTTERLKSPHPGQTVIDRTSLVDELPPLPHATVLRLLNRPFKSVVGEEWLRQGEAVGYAPTTRAPFHIVPTHYDGAHLEVTTKACMTCHDGVLTHVNSFDSPRDWYGHVRGDDAIFSFHPFEPADISHNGFSRWPRVRAALVEAGLLRRKE